MAKLLPLEYCPLERASQMLGCEVNDIIHWGSIGAIELAYIIPGGVYRQMMFVVLPGLWQKEGEPPKRDSLPSQDIIPYIEKWNQGLKSWIEYLKPINKGNPITSIYEIFGHCFSGLACGPYAINRVMLSTLEVKGEYTGALWLSPADTWGFDVGPHVLAAPTVEVEAGKFEHEIVTLKKSDIWITRPQLEKLHNHLTRNAPLPNAYSKPSKNRQKGCFPHTPAVDGIVDTPKGKAILTLYHLLKMIPDLDMENMSNTKIHNILEKISTNKGLGEFPITDKTFRDWLNSIK